MPIHSRPSFLHHAADHAVISALFIACGFHAALTKAQLRLLSLIVLGFATVSSAPAAVIANFDFQPYQGTQANFTIFAANALSVDTDLFSATSALSNSGFTSGGLGSFSINNTTVFSTSATPSSGLNIANAAGTNPVNYFAFSVTPDMGYLTTFDSISFYTAAFNANDQYNVEVRAWDGLMESSLGTISHTTPGSTQSAVVLKSLDFADFSASTATEFRFYAYNIDTSGGAVRFDDIVLNGNTTVAVPEPSRALLFGMAAGWLVLVRRRRQA